LTEINRWHEVAKPHTRSVLAVPPGFDGLLCALSCRFVAPCSRPWGSSSFESAPLARRRPPLDDIPCEAFPSLTASEHHQGCPCSLSIVPPRCWSRASAPLRVATQQCFWFRTSASRLCSVRESVVDARCCHHTPLVAPMGFWLDTESNESAAGSAEAKFAKERSGDRTHRAASRTKWSEVVTSSS
jgi:hypothetical protein